MTCTTGVAPQSLVLMGTADAGGLLYEVSDPLHPRLLCRIAGTSAHIVSADSIAYLKPVSSTKTDIIVRSLQSGAETTAGSFPFDARGWVFAEADWWPDGSLMSYTTGPADGNYGSPEQVWLYANHTLGPLTTYPFPLGDCVCRFGLPPSANAISPDGQYVVSGWLAGKGAAPFVVSRVADRSQVHVFDDFSANEVLWARTGHQLLLIGQNGVGSWTPESGITALAGSSQWTFFPSLSPDGSQAVYTTYIDQGQTQPRVFLYDFAAKQSRQLSQLPRTQVMFVKPGWVWYLEEATCSAGQGQCSVSSYPTGKVFAQELATGHETEVTFAPGEAPPVSDNWFVFQPADLWPLG